MFKNNNILNLKMTIIVISDIQKVKAFANIFRFMKDIIADVNIDMTEDKMYIQGMGEAQACLVELELQKEWFQTYEVKSPFVLGIHCEYMFKMIGCLEDGQKITMYMPEDGDKLNVDFDPIDNSVQKSIQKKFTMPLIMIDNEHLHIPDTEFQSDITMSSYLFADLIHQLSIFGETLKLRCTMESIDLVTNGDMGEMNASIKKEDITEYALEEDVVVNTCLSMKFVQKICAFSKISPSIYMHCSNDSPIKFHYSLDEKNSEDSQNFIRFFVAPKMDDE